SIFACGFTLRAAATVAADDSISEAEVVDRLTALVSKSLIVADVGDAEPRLRLLETTRAYALGKLAESGEEDVIGRRHADFFRCLLQSHAHEDDGAGDRLAETAIEIDNIRSALAWAF